MKHTIGNDSRHGSNDRVCEQWIPHIKKYAKNYTFRLRDA